VDEMSPVRVVLSVDAGQHPSTGLLAGGGVLGTNRHIPLNRPPCKGNRQGGFIRILY
jgi:hypothetical protein